MFDHSIISFSIWFYLQNLLADHILNIYILMILSYETRLREYNMGLSQTHSKLVLLLIT